MNTRFVLGTSSCAIVLAGLAGAGGYMASQYEKSSPASHFPQLGNCYATKESEQAQGAPLFVLDGKELRASDVPTDLAQELAKLESQTYARKKALVEQAAARIALARARDEGLASKEAPALSTLVSESITEAHIHAYYLQNKKSFPEGMAFSQLEAGIRAHLEQSKLRDTVRNTLSSLQEQKRFGSLLAPVCGAFHKFDESLMPAWGNRSAPHTVVNVTSFDCDTCEKNFQAMDFQSRKENIDAKIAELFVPPPSGGVLGETLVKGAWCASQESSDALRRFVPVAFATWKRRVPGVPGEGIALERHLASEAQLDERRFLPCLNSQGARDAVAYARQTRDELKAASLPVTYLNNKEVAPEALKALLSSLSMPGEGQRLSSNPSQRR